MKRSFLVLGFLLGCLSACLVFALILAKQKNAQSGSASSQKRSLQVAHSLPIDHPVHLGIEQFAKRLKELSGGQIECSIYPNGQRGKETTYLEKLQSGNLDIAKTSAAPIASFVPRMKTFSFPYLFKNRDHYWSVLDGDIGSHLLEKLSDRGGGKSSGFRGLCYYDAGSRNFYSVEAIKVPSDLKGKVIRVMQDDVAIAMMKAFEATPKPMGGGEIYGALQRGNIQGAENNPPTFVAQRHYEVCKHFSFDQHSRIPDLLLISDSLWGKLSQQEQNWVLTAARESSEFQRKLWQEKSDAAVEFMKKEGVQVYHPELKDFQEATAPAMKPLLDQEVQGILEDIKAHP